MRVSQKEDRSYFKETDFQSWVVRKTEAVRVIWNYLESRLIDYKEDLWPKNCNGSESRGARGIDLLGGYHAAACSNQRNGPCNKLLKPASRLALKKVSIRPMGKGFMGRLHDAHSGWTDCDWGNG